MVNEYNPLFFQRDIVSERPSFGQTLSASVGYTLDPLFETVGQTLEFGIQRQAGYNAMEDLGEYSMYATTLGRAVNTMHMASMKRTIDESRQRREILAQSTIGAQLVAGIFDPINLIALPFGGPVVGIGKSALRVGAGTAVLQTGIEAALIQPFDPLQTATESAMNIGMAAIFGAGFGAAFGAPMTAKAKAYAKTQQAIEEEMLMLNRIENLEGVTPDQLLNLPQRSDRPFFDLSDDDLNLTIKGFEDAAARTEQEANSYQGTGRPEAGNLLARVEELKDQARVYKNEKAFRELEDMGIDVSDPFRIMDSAFTNSIFYKAVSTPVKRLLQSKYPTFVKEMTVKAFSDSGTALALNSLGVATPNSVYQKAAVANGKWVAAHDQFIRLWASDTNAPIATRLDINFGDLGRRAKDIVTGNEDTYKKWLKVVSEKRIAEDTNLTPNEAKAVEIMNDYFSTAEKKLSEVGLIGNAKGLKSRIDQLEIEINKLKTERENARMKKTARGAYEARLIDDRLTKLSNDIAEDRTSLIALEDAQLKSERTENQDIFFPRFWDTSAIKKNRKEFYDTLYRWYESNPYIYEKNPRTLEFERITLSKTPENLDKRVNSTIAKILNEEDPLNIDNIGFGYGRSKHFRHRQVDIPNKLVTKFIITDPLAAMQTYAARIEPRYEYRRAFGKDVDGVIFDMEMDMIRKGFSQKDINIMRRDYMHMYDRVSGSVLRNPEAINQKIAFVLKEAAQFSYMGSAGLAALPDFGRIIMEYDLDNVIKGTQAIMDKNMVNMTVDEVRLAGEAIDILRGTSHMRLVEDLSNNINSSELLTNARNAFYILNGLAPMTTLAKQLSGIIDAHTIIDYSIRYKSITPQERTWLARYGIDEKTAAKIAKSPWEKSDNNLYMANTREWTNINFDTVRAEIAKTYKHSKKSIFTMSEKQLVNSFKDKFYVDRIITGKETVKQIFRNRGTPNILGFADGIGLETPATVYINFDNVRKSHAKLKNREDLQKFKDELDTALINGVITESAHAHQMGYVENIKLIETPNEFARFVLLHELHHTTTRQKMGESNAAYEKRIDDLTYKYLADEREEGITLAANKEFDVRYKDAEETVSQFRVALNSGVLNTIMAGTPADKPIITDGVAYLPINVAKQFGFTEDPKIKGYARIENGLMGLPFQFYSYTLANVNKTVAAFAHGQIKNRTLGIATSLGLAYLSLKLRTPEYIWEEMSVQDKFARSFDMSGIMALYSDLMYTGMHTSLALGGPNITGGILSPKFPQEPSNIDAIMGLAGAGPSWATDVGRGMYQFANGEYGEGARQIARNAPFARLWFLKDDINQITRAWAQ